MTSGARLALLALLGEGFFSRLSFGLVSFALPLYARQLGLSLGEVGLLISLASAINVFGKPLMGTLADRYGWRRTLLASIALRSVISLLFAACWLPWHLFGIRAMHGVSQSMRGPAVNALLADAGGKKAVASVFAWYSTARNVAASAGRAIAGVLLALAAGQFAPIFVAAFILSALPLFVVSRYVKEPAGRKFEVPSLKPECEPKALEQAPRRPGLWPIVSLGALMSGTAEMLRGIFPILATEYAGLGPAETGFIYLASTLVTMTAGPVFGWLSDHVSRELVLLVRAAANILSSAIYLFSPGLAGVTVAKLTDDMGKAAFRPAWGALMATASSHDSSNRARQMGMMGLGEDLGEMAGPLLAGVLLASGGIVALMGTRIALAAVTEVYTIVVTRHLHAAEQAAGREALPVQPHEEPPSRGNRPPHPHSGFTLASETATSAAGMAAGPFASGAARE